MPGNANSGRRPDPSRLKILRGKRPLNVLEPAPPRGSVEMPIGLSGGAVGVWTRIAPVAIAMGTLTGADVVTFVTLCELQATFDHVIAAKSAPGYSVFQLGTDSEGVPVITVNPAVKLERETAVALRPYYALFGLDPSARSRIYVRPADKTPEPMTKWT